MPPEMTPNTASEKILAIDLGKFKSVACEYEASSGNHSFMTIPTTPHGNIVGPAEVPIEGASDADGHD